MLAPRRELMGGVVAAGLLAVLIFRIGELERDGIN
jgi:hypothetical protein